MPCFAINVQSTLCPLKAPLFILKFKVSDKKTGKCHRFILNELLLINSSLRLIIHRSDSQLLLLALFNNLLPDIENAPNRTVKHI